MEKINIAIKGATSDESVSLFKQIYEKFLKDEKVSRIKIYYEKYNGMPSEISNPKEWSLQLWTKDNNIQISIYNCTAGYYGSGPSATEEILKLVGLKDDLVNEAVYEETSPGVVNREYSIDY